MHGGGGLIATNHDMVADEVTFEANDPSLSASELQHSRSGQFTSVPTIDHLVIVQNH